MNVSVTRPGHQHACSIEIEQCESWGEKYYDPRDYAALSWWGKLLIKLRIRKMSSLFKEIDLYSVEDWACLEPVRGDYIAVGVGSRLKMILPGDESEEE